MTSEFMKDLLSKDEKIIVEYKTCRVILMRNIGFFHMLQWKTCAWI